MSMSAAANKNSVWTPIIQLPRLCLRPTFLQSGLCALTTSPTAVRPRLKAIRHKYPAPRPRLLCSTYEAARSGGRGIISSIWTILAVYSAHQLYFSRIGNHPISWSFALAHELAYSYLWAIQTSINIWLARRLRIERRALIRSGHSNTSNE